jgi:hypothetical protein
MPHGDRVIMPKELPKVNDKLQIGSPAPCTSHLPPLSCASWKTSKPLVAWTIVATLAKGSLIAWADE